jgi:serine/threonine protein phosphatase PrpC
MDGLLDTEPTPTKESLGKPLILQFSYRNYNEDRVAIILNIMKPKHKDIPDLSWPKCSFFGVYDGHGGNVCADFLRDYLHQLVR